MSLGQLERPQALDESAYQRVLAARRPQPIVAEPVELQWKKVAGFNKIELARA
jgi:hypothetical protein